MLGFTGSGCFIIGIITGFILAAALGLACVFYFNPEAKEKSMSKVEQVWGQVKSGVDSSIDAAKKAPVQEPEITVPPQVEAKKNAETAAPAAPAAENAPSQKPRARIEINL